MLSLVLLQIACQSLQEKWYIGRVVQREAVELNGETQAIRHLVVFSRKYCQKPPSSQSTESPCRKDRVVGSSEVALSTMSVETNGSIVRSASIVIISISISFYRPHWQRCSSCLVMLRIQCLARCQKSSLEENRVAVPPETLTNDLSVQAIIRLLYRMCLIFDPTNSFLDDVNRHRRQSAIEFTRHSCP